MMEDHKLFAIVEKNYFMTLEEFGSAGIESLRKYLGGGKIADWENGLAQKILSEYDDVFWPRAIVAYADSVAA